MREAREIKIGTNNSSFAQLLAIFLLGISSGFPLALTASGGTFQSLATDRGFSLVELGKLTVLTLPFALKFLWAPFFDRFACPFFSFLGFRKGWLVATQLALALLYLRLGVSYEVNLNLILLLFALSFMSASQDIVVDAYRAELLSPKLRGAGASFAVMGYRIGMILSGAGALALGDSLPWEVILSICALVQLLACVPVVFAPREPQVARPRTLASAVINPFSEFWRRSGAIEILIFIFLYKAPDALGTLFTTRFLMDCGFSRTDIAAVVKGIGLAATLVGGLLAGAVMVRIPMRRTLFLFGIFQAITIIPFIILAQVSVVHHASGALLVAVIVAESLGSGMSSTAFVAFLMGLCKVEFAATQFALLSSVAVLARSLLGPAAGFVANEFGWEIYFIIAGLMNLPALWILYLRGGRWTLAGGEKL